MNLSNLTAVDLCDRLHGRGLIICSGPFKFRIFSSIDSVAAGLKLLYSDYPIGEDGDFVDFNVTLNRGTGLRRWWRPQVNFSSNGIYPFVPLPVSHAFPLLEWAMNWCISTQAHHYLMLHSAVIERDGCAVIMPAPPGSGKSTLCAGLVNRGWRLLSDELALISLTDQMITPLGRPISLKNQSIEVIRNFAPGAIFNQLTHDTSKGTVSHMKVPSDQLARIKERARPKWVIFPKYVPNSAAELTPRSKANSLLELGRNSFNYMVLGLTGFEVLSDVVSASDCYDFRYSQLEDAVAVFDGLVKATKS
jgi:HprK-related kinase A